MEAFHTKENKTVRIKSSLAVTGPLTAWIRKPSLRSIDMSAINNCMNYIGGAYTFVPFHVEEEHLSSLSYNVSELAIIWYIVPSAHKTSIEAFVAQKRLHPQFLNDHHGRGAQVICTKTIFFNPFMFINCYPQKKSPEVSNVQISFLFLVEAFIKVGSTLGITTPRRLPLLTFLELILDGCQRPIWIFNIRAFNVPSPSK